MGRPQLSVGIGVGTMVRPQRSVGIGVGTMVRPQRSVASCLHGPGVVG